MWQFLIIRYNYILRRRIYLCKERIEWISAKSRLKNLY